MSSTIRESEARQLETRIDCSGMELQQALGLVYAVYLQQQKFRVPRRRLFALSPRIPAAAWSREMAYARQYGAVSFPQIEDLVVAIEQETDVKIAINDSEIGLSNCSETFEAKVADEIVRSRLESRRNSYLGLIFLGLLLHGTCWILIIDWPLKIIPEEKEQLKTWAGIGLYYSLPAVLALCVVAQRSMRR